MQFRPSIDHTEFHILIVIFFSSVATSSTQHDVFAVYMMFFLGRNFVSGILCTLKPKTFESFVKS